MSDFLMPSLGADMDAGTVVAWRVQPGARVRRGEILAEVETEKGVFEVESPAAGVVADLVVARGTKVPVGTLLAHIEAEGVAAPAGALPTAAPAMRASPLARRVAADLGVDLATVTGTGPDGAITRADVERGAPARAPAAGVPIPLPTPTPVPTPVPTPMPTPVPLPGPEPEPIPVSKATPADVRRAMRHAVAVAVAKSKREIPHYYLGLDVDLARATAWLAAENARRPVTERILPATLLLKAVARGLRAHPALNGFWTGDEARASEAIHLGVAISLRGGGLIAPAIHDVDRLALPELQRTLQDLVRRARAGGLRGSEMTDPTITVTNLGDEGAASVFGVIYPPQLAIVGFGRVTPRPCAVDGMLGVHPMVSVTLAADHRATDGHYGGRFLAEIDRQLQQPEAL